MRIRKLFDVQNIVSVHYLNAIPLSFSEEVKSLETLLHDINLVSFLYIHLFEGVAIVDFVSQSPKKLFTNIILSLDE